MKGLEASRWISASCSHHDLILFYFICICSCSGDDGSFCTHFERNPKMATLQTYVFCQIVLLC